MRQGHWIAAACCLSACTLHAATVRGKITHAGQPKSGVKVTISSGSFGRSSPVFSGNDGFYSVDGIPRGSYVLELWPDSKGQPRTFQITVKEPFTDVFPIDLP